VQLVFIDPAEPARNAHVESFNGKVWEKFLSEYRFVTITDAHVLAAAFRLGFNTVRPHSAEESDAGRISATLGDGTTGGARILRRSMAARYCG
jgi:hypothetical protein